MASDENSSASLLFNVTRFCQQLAKELNLQTAQIENTVALLDEGNTIPFIARYRKEVTKGLDETQLRAIEDALAKARDLADRKDTILKTIGEQGQLTESLRNQIVECSDRKTLEDLYLPFKPRKRTRATIARERGLQPLADILLSQGKLSKPGTELLHAFVDPSKEVADETAALQGACDIVAETWSEDVNARRQLLEQAERSELACSVKRGKAEDGSKFEMYFDSRERISRMPSHRFLAMQRGVDEGVLKVGLVMDDDQATRKLRQQFLHNPSFEFRAILEQTVDDCYKRLLHPATESAVMQKLKEKADADAIEVFARNLRELLLAAPAGPQVTIGLDPGFRTGCKVAVVDATGKYLTSTAIYPTPPRSDLEGAGKTLLKLIRDYGVTLIAIGNGTASRETDAFVTNLIREHDLQITRVMVNESGASIYSASQAAIEEYPDLDVTIRGAISIAHRLQDPLAELVKIDPQSIGVGQYQHDVNQTELKKALDRQVESCVNSVGVDVNTASPSLLSYVAGIGTTLARRIVEYRDTNGRFDSRQQLLKVPRLGQKAFTQAAGFLRIRDGKQPLDNSAVHPEQYPLVQKMAATLQVDVQSLVGNESLAQRLKASDFVTSESGEFTVRDVLDELARPGRDPRSEFRTVKFSESAHEISDLTPGMKLEGVVTNVTRFGAFVDIGVHQDGLIHISQLADRFINDPSEEVAVGDIVKVTVLEVDVARKRISLSRKSPQ
ncbi:MAG: RNA-binding transcriptional accessory protein [Planctomycetaceae bacterium]|nr:RNA-binding transcriptional accessory protein [Planctomycetaceae bacterium]